MFFQIKKERYNILSLFIQLIHIANQLISLVQGHGTLIDPPARNYMNKAGFENQPANYDHMGLNCGGRSIQWDWYQGNCGLCGDSYGDRAPRKHELGGALGKGIVGKTYKQGATIPVTVLLSANHKGSYIFQLCNGKESEACFQRYLLTDRSGMTEFTVPWSTGKHTYYLRLPADVICDRCTIRWIYTAGNNAADQETFINCADIEIGSGVSGSRPYSPQGQTTQRLYTPVPYRRPYLAPVYPPTPVPHRKPFSYPYPSQAPVRQPPTQAYRPYNYYPYNPHQYVRG